MTSLVGLMGSDRVQPDSHENTPTHRDMCSGHRAALVLYTEHHIIMWKQVSADSTSSKNLFLHFDFKSNGQKSVNSTCSCEVPTDLSSNARLKFLKHISSLCGNLFTVISII